MKISYWDKLKNRKLTDYMEEEDELDDEEELDEE